MNKLKNIKKWKLAAGFFVTVILLILLLVAVWLATPYRGDSYVQEIISESSIDFRNDYILFNENVSKDTGIIIYPGGRVTADAYIPLVKEFNDEGYLTTIVNMPLNLAVLSPMKGEIVIQDFPEIKEWIVVGHSLGGSMAARFALEYDSISGLVFLASYPEESLNFSKKDLEVISIVGSNDGVVNKDKIEETKAVLPNDTKYFEIEGGNHAGFGSYGEQEGDNVADISNTSQIRQTVELILANFEDRDL